MINPIKNINAIIESEKKSNPDFSAGEVSDTYHTFNELYHHRMLLSAALFNTYSQYAWKSKLHDDGTMFDGMFIVGIETPEGAFTYHYDLEHWDLFDATELPKGRKWDGHTAKDIDRLLSLVNQG